MHRTEKREGTYRAVSELELPKIVLEITRGNARQKTRQVRGTVFVIGTAPDCDLVLGDPRFEAVHSYVFIRPDRVTIRQLGLGPRLQIGGRAVSWASLVDLDLLQMGPYEFQVRIEWPQASADAPRVGRRNSEILQIPIDGDPATQRLLDDVERHLPAPRLSLFVGDGQYESQPPPRHGAGDRGVWRQGQKKVSF
jgi:Inner membrane component of T3SS, cytoplasmic domain